jgi:hypothetical protein
MVALSGARGSRPWKKCFPEAVAASVIVLAATLNIQYIRIQTDTHMTHTHSYTYIHDTCILHTYTYTSLQISVRSSF